MRRTTPQNSSVARLPGDSRVVRSRHILVAEDDGVYQAVLGAILGEMGFRCDIVSSGIEAITAVTRGQYDLVLMDVQMPEMDGLTATRKIRQLPVEVSQIPIIALTDHATDGDRQECLLAGMNDHIPKPLNKSKLIAILAWLAPRDQADAAAASDDGFRQATAGGSEPAIGREIAKSATKSDLPLAPAEIIDGEILSAFADAVGWNTISDLMGALVEDLTARSENMVRAADTKDWEALANNAQGLMSVLGQFGAARAQETAHEIVTLCKAGDGDGARQLIPCFRQNGDDAMAELRQILATMAPR